MIEQFYFKQRGWPILHDDGEVGAKMTMDRDRFRDTMIGEGTKIDN